MLEGMPEGARGHVPQADGIVIDVISRQNLAVGTKHHLGDAIRTQQGVPEGARDHVPQVDVAAMRFNTGQDQSVGAECHVCLALQGVPEGARGHIPQTDGVTGTGEGPAIQTEGQTVDRLCMALQGVPEGVCGHVPQMDGAVLAGAGQDLSVGTKCHPGDGFRRVWKQEYGIEGVGIEQPDACTAPNRQARAIR